MTSNVSAENPADRRISSRLFEFWQEVRNERMLPLEETIDADKLQDVWDYCFLIQVHDIEQGGDYNYRYLGTEIKKSYGYDLDEKEVDSPLVSIIARNSEEKYRKVISSKRPAINEGEFTNCKGHKILYRQCLLPFSTDHYTVTTIFGGMRYKIADT